MYYAKAVGSAFKQVAHVGDAPKIALLHRLADKESAYLTDMEKHNN